MDYFQSAFNYLTDKGNKLIHKIFLVIAILSILFILDDFFSYSFYRNIDNKVTQISKINTALKDPSIDSASKTLLLHLRNEVLNRQSYFDRLLSSSKNINFNSIRDIITNSPNNGKPIERNFYLQYISSAWIELMFLFVITVTVPQIDERHKKAGTPNNNLYTKYFIGLIALLSIGYIHTIIFSFIPVPFGLPFLSYLLNFAINISLILLVNKLGDVFDKKKANG